MVTNREWLESIVGQAVVLKNKKDAIIEDQESCLEEGMMCRITQIYKDFRDPDCYVIATDQTGFEEYNKRFSTPNYYDDKGKPTLRVYETPFYELKPNIWILTKTMEKEYDKEDLFFEVVDMKSTMKNAMVKLIETTVATKTPTKEETIGAIKGTIEMMKEIMDEISEEMSRSQSMKP